MEAKITSGTLKTAAVAVVAVAVVFAAIRGLNHYHAGNANSRTIGVFYNSMNLTESDLDVIRLLVDKKVSEINAAGGIAGKPVKVQFLDDKENPETALQLVKETIYNDDMIAYLGLWSSTRVKAVADLVGKEGVPFFGGYSVTEVAADYPNLFTYEVEVNRLAEVVHRLLKAKAKRVAFISNSGDVFSESLLKAIQEKAAQGQEYELVVVKWFAKDHTFSEKELQELMAQLQQHADFLLLSTYPMHSNVLVEALGSYRVKLPVFTAFIDIPEIRTDLTGFEEQELYDVSVFGIPSALSLRCQELEARYRKQLKEGPKLQFQVGLGGLYADIIGLLKEAAESKEAANEATARARISRGLRAYVNGQRVYRGWYSNWYFTPDRVLVNEVLLGWKPSGQRQPVLAPIQYLQSDTGLQQAPVYYTNIDLVQLDQVNSEKGTFQASFFLEITSEEPVSLEQVEFVNALRNNVNQQPLLAVKLLKAKEDTLNGSPFSYLYSVTGMFQFEPELQQYPFDRQSFPITLQTNSALRPYLIQPPYQYQTDTLFASPGWRFRHQFVGFDQDLIYSGSRIIPKPQHIPYYKFSFTYVLKRAKVDFFLKVLTPLLVILVVAYLSVYIPIREFISIAAIQVTALLSAIALYFSAYKPGLAAATVSDKIFIFTYVMITTMIGASVLQYLLHRRRRSWRRLSTVVALYERVLFPIIIAGFTLLLVLQLPRN